ncbi:MAG: SMC-Scp complex subunit ScpB [Thermoanaerobaculia bacterium]|nr:SMC-Scp complex subunit ScpB [Thermoanaerobaculia bacterium]
MTTRADMESVIEAVLFVANDPVSRERLADIFGTAEQEEARQAVDAVVQRYSERPESGILIDDVAGGLRLVSRPDLHGYLRRFFEVSSANKLSMAALETLAIVAYRQPVTAPEIQELRGVASQGVLRTLLERRLVRIAGRKEVVGKPFLYATTREFLLHFGLRSLKELPPLEQFEELLSEGLGDSPGDPEEAADREAAELGERDDEATDEAERQEEEWQREEEEARQQAQETEEAPDSESDEGDPESTPEARMASDENTDHPVVVELHRATEGDLPSDAHSHDDRSSEDSDDRRDGGDQTEAEERAS